jgi:hypothetical protein
VILITLFYGFFLYYFYKNHLVINRIIVGEEHMSLSINKRTAAIVIGFITLLTIVTFPAYAVEMHKTDVTRISHPAYQMNQYYAQGSWTDLPWNQNGTKILMYESPSFTFYANNNDFKIGSWQPSTNIQGRGTVWANIADLRAAVNESDLDAWFTAYQSATHQINTTSHYEPRAFAWSPRTGEENILYILTRPSYGNKLVKCDVSTLATCSLSTITTNGTCTAESDTNCVVKSGLSGSIYILGFTPDGSSIYTSGDRITTWCTSALNNPIYKIPFSNPSNPTTYSHYPCSNTVDFLNWPSLAGTHHHVSPDREWIAGYHGGASINDPECTGGLPTDPASSTCNGITDIGVGLPLIHQQQQYLYADDYNPYNVTHIHWIIQEWFVGGSLSLNYRKPTLHNWNIVQVFFNPTTKETTHNLLHTQLGAGYWDENGAQAFGRNYHSMPSPSQRIDGKQIHFVSSDGKYSYADYKCVTAPASYDCQSEAGAPVLSQATVDSWGLTSTIRGNWGTLGVFLIDLASDSGAQTCTSFTYTAWTECQPNNTQTRTVTSSSPSGCSGGTPVLEQSCSYTGTSLHNLLKATSTPVIDGNLGEYTLAEALTFSPSSGGNTVTVKTLWDAEALYFGIEVADTELNASVTTRDGSVWSEDAIEWFVDTYNDGGSLDPNSPYMRTDDYQGIVNIINTKYDAQGTTSGTPSGSWNGAWLSAVKLNGTNSNNSDTDSGYTIEIKVPWTSIGYSIPPSTDTIVGMSFAIDDKDSSSFSSLMWPNLLVTNQNASNWQKVTLSGSFAVVDSMPPKPPVALMIQ